MCVQCNIGVCKMYNGKSFFLHTICIAAHVKLSWQTQAAALSLLQLPRSHDLGWAKLVSVGVLWSTDRISLNFCQISLAPEPLQ